MELVFEEFDSFCRLKDIKRHKTSLYNPQQNGVIERINRTLVERVRCLLVGAGMPNKFWGEALSTACYIVNKSPSIALEFKTPDQLYYGKTTNYSHLKPFGCLAYTRTKQDNLDPMELKCVMQGYPIGTKGYRLWYLEQHQQKVITTRDATFNESQFPFLERKMNGTLTTGAT